MKVILLKDVDELGEQYDVINVSDGYSRNYLFPRNLAILATEAALAQNEKRLGKITEEKTKKKQAAVEQAEVIGKLTLKLLVDAGEGGKLFGAVTAQDIAEALRTQANMDMEKRKIHINAPIKMVGTHQVTIKLHTNVVGNLSLAVERKKE
ncbi:MAG: 50S ribosomal protein L9 [Candidatus Saganbacteria bacterium]|nr:50S ribosomal protein L9 [Candidatus Saganbacteria bacterium]